jgi:predicted anti-sigma-YlaC factor YlaD
VREITCESTWRLLTLDVDGDSDKDLRILADLHLRVCFRCKSIYEATENVARLVAKGLEYELPEGFSKRLYYKIKDM